jgi:hypothetical protein
LKLSKEEQLAFDKIKAISRKDTKTLRDVFISLLKMITIETYTNKEGNGFYFHIPYICGINVKYFDKLKYNADGSKKGQYTEVEMEAVPAESFISEIEAISTGEITPSEKYIKRKIIEKFSSLLDLQDEIEIDE